MAIPWVEAEHDLIHFGIGPKPHAFHDHSSSGTGYRVLNLVLVAIKPDAIQIRVATQQDRSNRERILFQVNNRIQSFGLRGVVELVDLAVRGWANANSPAGVRFVWFAGIPFWRSRFDGLWFATFVFATRAVPYSSIRWMKLHGRATTLQKTLRRAARFVGQ